MVFTVSYGMKLTCLVFFAMITDSLGLDIHHVVEQVGRFTAYKVFGFNGMGGVWRHEAIE